MCLSSICVVVNAMRLRSMKPIGAEKGKTRLMQRLLKRENAQENVINEDNEIGE